MGDQRRQQQPRRHSYQGPPHGYPPPVYGYAMNPAWMAAQGGMMPPHHMHGAHGYQGGYPTHPMDGIPLPPGIGGIGGTQDPLEAFLGPFTCARLRNLPHEASLQDVLVFFQGLVIIDVVLQGNGEGFVIFANPMDFQMALQRDRQTMGRRYIDVTQGSRQEFYAAIAQQYFNVTQQERHVASLDMDDEDQELSDTTPSWSGGPTPSQTLSTQQQGQAAGGYRNKGIMSGRGGGMRSGVPQGGGLQTRRTGGGIQVGEHTGFLRMRGLPFSSTKGEIYEFFEGYNPIEQSIVLTYRNDGRATGEGYVQFATPDDAKNAMVLHRKSMGTRYIELFISNKDEHARAFARFSDR